MPTLTAILRLAVVLEMTYTNLYTVYICCTRRRSRRTTWAVLHLFTLLLVSSVMWFLSTRPNFGNGNGLFVFAGCLYLFPMRYLFCERKGQIASVACTSWIYTMLLFSVSVRLAGFFPDLWFTAAAAVIQTLLYALTLPSFLNVIHSKLVPLLKSMSAHMKNMLLLLSITGFVTLVLVNYALVVGASNVLKLLLVLCIGSTAILSYKFYFDVLDSGLYARSLENAVIHDPLTGLKNRASFQHDVQSLLEGRDSFSVFFIDLDRFKSVNDTYGHVTGDKYLKCFADTLSSLYSEKGKLYRMAGDEFLFLYTGPNPGAFEVLLKGTVVPACADGVSFRGFSAGRADYPSDGDNLQTLLSVADYNMYRAKQKNRQGAV